MSETRESFFVGGRYIEVEGGSKMIGQAYVQRRAPQQVRQPFPIVMIHGWAQTAVNFETTPDGRPGWADYFVDEGFAVYLVDQPGRGRSLYLREAYGEPSPPGPAEWVEEYFTAPATAERWPQARLHSQWPGTGKKGDPAFDQFYASQGSGFDDGALREHLNRDAGAALLDRIGPAILLSHSQSGAIGWQIADARPDLVRGIVAVEPSGPPFVELQVIGAPEYLRDGAETRRYGVTIAPIEYDPPVLDPAVDLETRLVPSSDPTALVSYRLQREPARRLANIARVKVLVVTAEASYHAPFDHATVAYLRQAGVEVTHLALADRGIYGNGHMMMLERNSDEIAAAIHTWLSSEGCAESLST